MKGYRWLSLGAVSAITALSASAASPAAATAVAARPAAGSACAGVLVPEPDPLSLGGATTVCKPVGLETPADLMKAQSYDAARQLAPYTGYRPEALRAAVADKQALYANQATVPNATGSWSGIGQPPLHNDSTSPAYNQAPPPISNQNQLGWPMLSGRVTSVAYDTARAGRWFLSSGGGGVWETTDAGASWRSIGDSLPVQIIGAMAFSPAFGGTLIAGSGDNATGTFGQPGLGVFRSVDDGASWQTANGIPDGILTYRITVDPTNATTVYAATSKGLYRSTDDGQSYTNVLLPTTCVTYLDAKCFFANFVTDVVVRPNDSNGHGGGKVLAAVGWRLGQAKDADGTTVQAPQNGIYESDSGLPTTFHFIDPGNGPGIGTNGFSSTPNVGRVSLGIAHGAAQNHDVVYALVSNAVAMQNCAAAADLDTPLCNTNVPTATATFLEGAFASTDFGVTWKQIMDPLTLKNPDSGSALVGLAGYSPGIQSWYNTYIDPDPTVQDPTGVPTRVIVGLEEVWENDQNVEGTTTTAATTWHTISRYWNACTGNFNGIVCSANTQAGLGGVTAGTTTEHPDHHGEAFIPDATGGGVTLLEGNDGGVWKQHIASGADFNNDQWANGVNNGLQTVETYNASISKDGTIIAGLQDNGLMRIDGKTGREDMIFGGDAFLSYVDPTNSQNMIEEYVNGIANYTIDGGQHWCFIDPGLTKPFGEVPMVMDPTDPNHVLTAGQDVQETTNAFAAPTGQCDPSATQNTQVNYWNGTNPATGAATFNLKTAPSGAVNRATAADLHAENAYVAFCSNCTPLCPACNPLSAAPFGVGLATNVGGSAPPAKGSSSGWHFATAHGLPNRFITSVRIDPHNPRTVYATLGGYGYRWLPPGATKDDISKVGSGHVYVSKDAGQNFTDITGDLPDVTANDTMIHNGQLLVANELGVFISTNTSGGTYAPLGSGLPNVRVRTLVTDPANANHIVVGTAARGVYGFTFAPAAAVVAAASPSPPLPNTTSGHGSGSAVMAWIALLALVSVGAALALLGQRRAERRR